MNFSTISRRYCDSVIAAWIIGHLKPGPPAICPFHTLLSIHSLKQDKGSRLPTLNRLSLTSQNDLDKLVKWSEKWQILLNFGKCKCLHTGQGNLDTNYNMGDTVLGTTVKEKDLGITTSADMKVSEQCGIAASRGNQILGLIRRNITYKEKTNHTSV